MKKVIKKRGLIPSGKDITRLESFGDELRLSVNCTYKLSHIPGEVFLKNSLAVNTKFSAKCIESGFCGVRLITTVKDGHVIVRNLSDLIAMKANNRDASCRIKMYRSVARLPVDVGLNSGTHLGFDLTHEMVDFFDSYKIANFEGSGEKSGRFADWHKGL